MGGKPRIIVAEDNEIFAALMSEALETDFDVTVVHNGLQCIALCLERIPDAVVTDISMPDFDGVQMLRQFQKDPRFSRIPVLVVTATHFTHSDKAIVSRFPQVKGILNKDASIDILAEEVRRILPAPSPGAA